MDAFRCQAWRDGLCCDHPMTQDASPRVRSGGLATRAGRQGEIDSLLDSGTQQRVKPKNVDQYQNEKEVRRRGPAGNI